MVLATAPTSWTEIDTYRQCPHKHQLHYKAGWRPPKTAFPLARGILWHEIMDCHYNGVQATGDVCDPGKGALGEIIELLNQHGAKNPKHPDYDLGMACLWMYYGYRRWSRLEDQGWKIIEVEVKFDVELPNGMQLTGRVDLVIEYKGHLWIVDHKATTYLPGDKETDLDDQTPIYIWAMRKLGYDVRGAWVGYTRAKQLATRELADKERFKRIPVFRPDYDLETTVAEAAASISAAYGRDNQHQRHTNPDTCKWKCPFTEACIGGRRAPHLEQEILLSLGFKQRGRQLAVVREPVDLTP